MKVDLSPKGSGKTEKLIRQSAETGYCIVCNNQKEATRLGLRATELGLNMLFPLTYSEFLKKQYCGRGIKGFLIDNADMLLQYLSGNVPVTGVSMTLEKEDGG